MFRGHLGINGNLEISPILLVQIRGSLWSGWDFVEYAGVDSGVCSSSWILCVCVHCKIAFLLRHHPRLGLNVCFVCCLACENLWSCLLLRMLVVELSRPSDSLSRSLLQKQSSRGWLNGVRKYVAQPTEGVCARVLAAAEGDLCRISFSLSVLLRISIALDLLHMYAGMGLRLYVLPCQSIYGFLWTQWGWVMQDMALERNIATIRTPTRAIVMLQNFYQPERT